MPILLLLAPLLLCFADVADAWEEPFPASRFDAARTLALLPGDDIVAVGDVHPTNASRVADFALTRYDGLTGARMWRTTIDGPLANEGEAEGRTDAGNWVAATSSGDVIAVGRLAASPVLSTDFVARFDGVTGAEQWRSPVFEELDVGCCSTGPQLVVDDADDVVLSKGGVRKLDGATGAEIWRLPGGVFSAPIAVAAGGDVAIARQGEMTVVDGATAATVWAVPEVGRFFHDVVVDPAGDVIAIAVITEPPLFDPLSYELVKFAAGTGTVLWRTVLPHTTPAPAIAFGGLKLVVDGAGDLFATGNGYPEKLPGVLKVSGMSGAVLWQSAVRRFSALATAPGGDVFAISESDLAFLSTSRDRMYRLDGATGAFIWNALAFGPEPVVDSEETVFVPFGRGLGSKAGGVVTAYSGELTGRSLVVSDRAGVPSASRLVVASTDPTAMIPFAGGPSDPLAVGGQLELRNPVTNESAVFPLPAANWSNVTPPSVLAKELFAYRYSDGRALAGPCTKVELRGGKSLKATCRGAGIGFTLDESTQGALDVRLTIGTITYCMRFGGTVKSDRPGSFKATNAGPADCQ